MRLTFASTNAGIDSDDDALVVGASGTDSSGREHYVLLQRDPQDADDDWGIHFEYDDQAYGDYNLIARCRLSPTRLSIDLTSEAKDEIGIQGVDVTLTVDSKTYRALGRELGKIFRGHQDLLEVE